MINLRTTSTALAAAAMLFAAPAFAAFPNDCSTADTFVAATACAGVYTSNGGNNNGAGNTAIADLTAAFGDLGWAVVADELPFVGGGTGTITIDPAVSGPFAIALKAGSARSGGGYSLYFFDASNLNVASLDFLSTPASKDLSHASLYAGVVPEPETYALMLAGLAGLGFMVRRRRG